MAPTPSEIDTEHIRRIALSVAEATVREHQKDCPSINAVAASLADMRDEVRTGFDRVHERLDGLRDSVSGAMNVSGRHSERLKALERKKHSDGSSSPGQLSPGTNRTAVRYSAPSEALTALDPEDKPLISPKLINNAITALVVAIAAAAGSAIWSQIHPAPAPTPQTATTAPATPSTHTP
jgi:hypothetical protein